MDEIHRCPEYDGYRSMAESVLFFVLHWVAIGFHTWIRNDYDPPHETLGFDYLSDDALLVVSLISRIKTNTTLAAITTVAPKMNPWLNLLSSILISTPAMGLPINKLNTSKGKAHPHPGT